MSVNDRVVPKANGSFHGKVVSVDYDGTAGFVKFLGADDPDDKTFYSASELDLDPDPPPWPDEP